MTTFLQPAHKWPIPTRHQIVEDGGPMEDPTTLGSIMVVGKYFQL